METWYTRAAEAIADEQLNWNRPLTVAEIEAIIIRVRAEWYIEMANG